MEAWITLFNRLLSEREVAHCEDEGPEYCLAEPLQPAELEGLCRLDCNDEDEALRCGLKSDRSLAADLADSTEEAPNRETVWKNGSDSRVLF